MLERFLNNFDALPNCSCHLHMYVINLRGIARVVFVTYVIVGVSGEEKNIGIRYVEVVSYKPVL